jgi:ribonuclease-3
MAIGKEIFELQSVIEYEFSDLSYLERAVTHSSFAYEMRSKGMNILSNERLEFLGDAILQIVVSEFLYDNFELDEGKLTVMRQKLVCEKALYTVGNSIDLGEYIHLGKGEEGDCRTSPKVIANTLEALIGAVFLDCRERGKDDYKDVVLKLFHEYLAFKSVSPSTDYKTMLQKLCEKDGLAELEYRVIEESGPDHDKTYTVGCFVNNNMVGTGVARKKRDAEKLSAKIALQLFGYKEQ